MTERLRALPSVDLLLREPVAADLLTAYGREATLNALRTTLDQWRERPRPVA